MAMLASGLMVQSNGNSHPANREDRTFRVAIAATFTAEPLRRTISFWGGRLGITFEAVFAPYNQVLQTLLTPTGEFAGNHHGANVVLVRLEDLNQFDAGHPEFAQRLRQNVDQLGEALEAARFRVPTILAVCPASEAFSSDPQRKALIAGLTESLEDQLTGLPSVHVLRSKRVDDWYPVEIKHDADGDRLGKIPYTESYYCAVGTALVRWVHALTRAPYKVIALDCDNTLWEGICGEDGPEGVRLDSARRALHEFMLAQRSEGMLLALDSKNNEGDVEDTFGAHPEFPLQLEHFVARRLNWETKADNLVSIAEQLSLGLDSFVFIDDSPKECAELTEALPQVVALPLPVQLDWTGRFLQHVWAFDHPVVTAEDRHRNERYQQVAGYHEEVRRAGDLESFLATLDLKVHISPMRPEQVARVAQMTQRTNQFNLTTRRRSEAEISSLDEATVHVAEVADRFGEYGLTGVAIAEVQASEYVVDTLLLSCRVLGRGVEHRFLANLAERAAEAGCEWLVLRYLETPKNQPARQFIDSIDIGERKRIEGGFELRLPVVEARALRWRQPKSDTPAVGFVGTPVRSKRAAQHVDYAAIANSLATVPQILAAMRVAAPLSTAEVNGMSSVERELALIWSELLENPAVAREDNFFDLGGHSLLAVLLLLRIRETFGVELSIDDVYSGTLTLADLAAHIEAAQLGEVDPDEYAALLAEIEGMTDEEARALLAQEAEQA